MTATRILVLPGIGDILWVAVALRDWARRQGLAGRPLELHVWDFDGRRRGGDLVDRIPFVQNGGYFHKPPHPFKRPQFHQSYYTGERSVFPGFLGFDFYLAPNGVLRQGGTVGQAFDCLEEWDVPWRRSPAELEAEARFRDQHGPYIVGHFSDFGMLKPWAEAWGPDACATFCRLVHEATGATVLLTGSSWDQPFTAELARRLGPTYPDLAGQTSPTDFYAMLHGASGVVGWCGGNTILGATLGKPTLICWSRQTFPNPLFYRHACPPGVWERSYRAIEIDQTTPTQAAGHFAGLWQARQAAA